MKSRLIFIALLIIGIILIAGCVKKSLESEIPPIDEQKPIYEIPDTKEPIPIERANYIVIVNSNSIFKSEAEKFANNKNAELLTYSQNFNEVMNELKNKKPVYIAIFATPEELTPDFIDNVDLSLRDIDDDPFLDTAFGIVTSKNTVELKKYVDKLINYVPQDKLKIYAVSPKYTYRNLEPDFGIDIKHHCLTNCGGAFCLCDDENRATLDRVQDSIKNANIFVVNAHGTSSFIQLDNGESIRGSTDGIYGSNEQKIDLTHNTVLSIAESCTTGRINGKPNIIDTRYGDTDVTGQIDTSLVLSFLQSGTLNYLASTHVANGAIDPEETFIEESFLQQIPIGVALKDLKNRYILVTEKYVVAMPGSPTNTDEFTKDFILFQVRNWILFGDPSIVLSNEQYKPINCIKSYMEKQIGNKKEVEIQVQFRSDRLVENSQYIDKMEKENVGQAWGQLGVGVCVVKIPYIGKLIDIKVTSVSGVSERYQNGKYPANAFYQDLGGEIFVQVPWYAAIGGMSHEKPIVLNYEITTE